MPRADVHCRIRNQHGDFRHNRRFLARIFNKKVQTQAQPNRRRLAPTTNAAFMPFGTGASDQPMIHSRSANVMPCAPRVGQTVKMKENWRFRGETALMVAAVSWPR